MKVSRRIRRALIRLAGRGDPRDVRIDLRWGLEQYLGIPPGATQIAERISERIELMSERAFTAGDKLERVDIFVTPFSDVRMVWHMEKDE